MLLTEEQVKEISQDARVYLSEDELVNLTVQLNQIIASIEVLGEYDLEGVRPTFHPIAGLANVMRDDQVANSISVELALSNTAQSENGQFRVPPILLDLGDDQ
jgi:aspartyl-tRNA(Asn)/glutamyl-tRNA(Gln) amidotransferase subunit C